MGKHQGPRFMSTSEAREYYGLTVTDSLFQSEFDATLSQDGIAPISMPVSDSDFKQLTDAYEECIYEHPDLLAQTYYLLDSRFGNEVGNQRKEQKIDPRSGLQLADPKNFIHFTEGSEGRWQEQFASAPVGFRGFLRIGREIHQELLSVAIKQIGELEETHPNISRAFFEGRAGAKMSRTFMRLLSYDGHLPRPDMGEVAKPHYDIGGLTIQAYADASGFWAAPGGVNGERSYHDTSDGQAYFFAGIGHRKLYGRDDAIKPLWHGVDRIVPPGVPEVPERHTVVMFIDAPRVDYDVRPADTLPQLINVPAAVDIRA